MDHPSHIHVRPFQLAGADGIIDPAMRDVINVVRGSRYRIRMRFADFAGKTMYHCHILDHEDLGMMGFWKLRPTVLLALHVHWYLYAVLSACYPKLGAPSCCLTQFDVDRSAFF